jgi:hypothetical protein
MRGAVLWAGECPRHLVNRLLFGKTDGDLAALAMQEPKSWRWVMGSHTVRRRAAGSLAPRCCIRSAPRPGSIRPADAASWPTLVDAPTSPAKKR